MDSQQISIKPFEREDQDTVRNLILDGLAEHWDEVDTKLNPDLNDIGASYEGATFLVAWLDGEIVGSGALVPSSDHVAEIVRMSVAAEYRRHGIGRQILERLCQKAKESGIQRIVLETSSSWTEAIVFYRRFGFRVTSRHNGRFGCEVHFALDLATASGR
ncbi:MAG: GNAT family N-acetyltransferase [Gemmatimonadota bacterium]|nr:GNAT family N-acetyltransferase [Gemmatimonadota bacterium]